MSQPLFSLGQILSSPEALDAMLQHGIDPKALLAQHASGDISFEEKKQNNEAVRKG